MAEKVKVIVPIFLLNFGRKKKSITISSTCFPVAAAQDTDQHCPAWWDGLERWRETLQAGCWNWSDMDCVNVWNRFMYNDDQCVCVQWDSAPTHRHRKQIFLSQINSRDKRSLKIRTKQFTSAQVNDAVQNYLPNVEGSGFVERRERRNTSRHKLLLLCSWGTLENDPPWVSSPGTIRFIRLPLQSHPVSVLDLNRSQAVPQGPQCPTTLVILENYK